jgi:4-coumarate--CoA ligase
MFLILDKVSYHKKLRGGVRFIQEIPKSASGKILKGKLSELLNK